MQSKAGHNTTDTAPECKRCKGDFVGVEPSLMADGLEMPCDDCHGLGHYCPGGEVEWECGGTLYDIYSIANIASIATGLPIRCICTACRQQVEANNGTE